MSKVIVTQQKLIDLADSIRTKTGSSDTLSLDEMKDAVRTIPIPERKGGKYFARVVDYDGEVLKEEWLSNGDTFTLPEIPVHEGLVFDCWSCSQDIVNNQTIVNNNNIMAGPIYHTQSGKIEVVLFMSKKSTMTLTGINASTVEWGDGSTGSLTHTYAKEGYYTIKFTNPDATFFLNLTTYGFERDSVIEVRMPNTVYGVADNGFAGYRKLARVSLPSTISSNYAYSNTYNGCYALKCIIYPPSVHSLYTNVHRDNYNLKYAVIPSGFLTMRENSGVFYNCPSLRDIVLPNGFTTLGGTFYGCYSLSNIILPDTLKTIGQNCFYNCYSLNIDKSPSSVTSYGNGCFYGCNSLDKFIVPSSITVVNQRIFGYCLGLSSVVFEGDITSVASQVFAGCSNIKVVDFRNCTSVPGLENVNAFSNTHADLKIIVPDSLYTSWTSATNWADISSKLIKVSDWEAL